ncbi:multiprotein-bridging factor 1 family protein [Streptomyces sp. NPDC079020]|uniref:multiprotein-bridging factor 1 family protein n=1 Tax=Streptomyces sp. NPDC079020 TaxID=3365722 RepID=UPI0037D69660
MRGPRRGLSQEVLAGLVGRTTDWLSKAENNRIELDRLSVITSLAKALDVSRGLACRADPHGLVQRQRQPNDPRVARSAHGLQATHALAGVSSR